MLRAHRIIRAQLAQVKRAPDRLVDSAAHLDQPAQRAFRVRGPGVKQDAIPDLRDRVNPLADRTGWIAAPQCYCCDQQMGEGVQHQIRKAGKPPRGPLVLFAPRFESGSNLTASAPASSLTRIASFESAPGTPAEEGTKS